MSEHPEKPDGELAKWAEGDGAQTSEPVNERESGWPDGYVPPAEQKNWLQRMLGRWIQWLAWRSENHVHDGGVAPESTPKVDLEEHIGYGENGGLSVDADSIFEHRIEHAHADEEGVATFSSDRLVSTDHLRSDTLRSLTEDRVTVKGAGSAETGILASSRFEASQRVESDVVRSMSGDTVEVQDSDGNAGTASALNTAKSWVWFDPVGEADGLIDAEQSFNIDFINRATDGSDIKYEIAFSNGPSSYHDVVGIGTIRRRGSGPPATPVFCEVVVEDTSAPAALSVYIFDAAGNSVDAPISLVFFWEQ